MNTTFTRPNASSDETEEVRSVFNHTQHDQSHNSIYLVSPAFEAHPQNLQQSLPRQIFQSNSAVLNDAQLIAEFIDTWLDDSVQADPQNLQQSLPRQNFQSNSAVLNDAQLIAEFFYTWLDDSVQEVTHGSVSQFLNQYMGPELFAKIRGTSTFCAKDYKKSSTKKRNWNPIALELFFSLLEQHKEVVRQLTSNHGCVKRGLWEYISYTLSQYGHKNFSPPQCACKWKNIKQDYKKNIEYMYKLEVDSILGSNWHKFA
ncbi:hypothetical protein RhiirA5_437176, partial [Rhizophagus irregularis]